MEQQRRQQEEAEDLEGDDRDDDDLDENDQDEDDDDRDEDEAHEDDLEEDEGQGRIVGALTDLDDQMYQTILHRDGLEAARKWWDARFG